MAEDYTSTDEYKKVQQFFDDAKPPPNFEQVASSIRSFIDYNVERGLKIALVTSGGTTIPLEKNTVRYLDNFSGGRRGASSTEYFLMEGYAVIFLHRRHSLQPFSRHFLIHHDNAFLNFLTLTDNGRVEVAQDKQQKVIDLMKAAQTAYTENRLLQIPFFSLTDYLVLLRSAAESLARAGKRALFFSAAAVSDFYLPSNKVVEHKIQSSEGLKLDFLQVPKTIKTLRLLWAPEAFVVTFKLETDRSLLPKKAAIHYRDYGVNAVIGNILGEHQDKVTVFLRTGETTVFERTEEERKHDTDLEEKLIPFIASLHKAYCGETD